MKKMILKIVIAASILAGVQMFSSCSRSSLIRVEGSDTVLPLSQKLAESYMKANPSQTVSVTGGGSGTGIASLMSGNTDIAQSSRNIRLSEVQKLESEGKSHEEVIIARDALAVIVNPGNEVSELTREQLEGIFTGEINNWSEVGGADLRIIPYARESSSGTYEFFQESVLRGKNYMNGIMSMPATGAIVQSVRQTPGAIAYIGLAYLNNDMKAISVSYDQGRTFVAPSIANAKNNTYPIVRPLFYYYLTSDASKISSFIDYILSPAGQKLVQEVGYITVN
jgi:phosphate transport system substrate-binding protein